MCLRMVFHSYYQLPINVIFGPSRDKLNYSKKRWRTIPLARRGPIGAWHRRGGVCVGAGLCARIIAALCAPQFHYSNRSICGLFLNGPWTAASWRTRASNNDALSIWSQVWRLEYQPQSLFWGTPVGYALSDSRRNLSSAGLFMTAFNNKPVIQRRMQFPQQIKRSRTERCK